MSEKNSVKEMNCSSPQAAEPAVTSAEDHVWDKKNSPPCPANGEYIHRKTERAIQQCELGHPKRINCDHNGSAGRESNLLLRF